MRSGQEQIVLNNLERALAAEEKQGFANTGAVGGFHSFLLGILPRLKQIFPAADLSLLNSLAQQYAGLSPLNRRQALNYLHRLLDELKQDLPNRGTVNDTSTPGPKTTTPISVIPRKRQAESITQSSVHDKSVDAVPGSLQYLKGVGPERAKQLEHLGIYSVKDLLLYYPRRYEDRRLSRIVDLKDGEQATVAGKVIAAQVSQGRTKVIKLTIEQEGRTLYAVWFNQTYILKQYPIGTNVVVSGKVRWQHRVPELLATDIVKGKAPQTEIIPVYSETARLSSKVFRNLIKSVIDKVPVLFPEILPSEDVQDWMDRPAAYQEIHFPSSFAALAKARERLVLEELLFLQLAVARLRQGVQRLPSPALTGGGELVRKFLDSLPFELTSAQKRVIKEIFHDMSRTKGMARLVQGDVGSGKTAVAMAALLRAVGSGYQGALMVPTEILAMQHYESLSNAFTPLGIKVTVLLGSQSRSEREKILQEIEDGVAQVVVGTHALIQENVKFHALGLAITDEQHRFGVRQRTMLLSKGESPHVLVLTATPIPRTLALTLYGDLQLSVLDELPKGRKPVLTRKLSERGRPNLEKFLDEQISAGRQVYVVCPLVEESESLDLVSATERYEALQKRFPYRKVALLHGRMKGTEKEEIMQAFQAGDIDILVSTTVVEVGVNVPNATVMVIEGAERFGLAQLHQLRGRVGRGSEQSYCILMSNIKDSRRLDVLCETQDGFKIAEEDLRLRGPGDLLGTKQHGLLELRLADLSRDGRLVEKAYQIAQKVLASPTKYELLLKEVDQVYSLEKVGLH